jgi:hypothetical protein
MTARNIEIMDKIVDMIAAGDKMSKALEKVYTKRNVLFFCDEKYLSNPIVVLGLSPRAYNALMRAKLRTIDDTINCFVNKKSDTIKGFGTMLGVETFEAILDYCWDHMTDDKKVKFLIDAVQRNEGWLRQDI